ncbi:MAG: fibronectin type III domain-containing protein [Nitrospinae bacterium]|nr:fibronectin type III domain-containing protein [Nitrospinota bacterium]
MKGVIESMMPERGRRRSRLIAALSAVILSVSMFTACKGSVESNQAAATFGAPTGVSVTANNSQLTVDWNAVVGAASYKIYQSTTAGGSSAATPVAGVTGTEYTATKLTNTTTYYYSVSAVDGAGTESALSGEVSGKPLAVVSTAPAAPAGTSANGCDAATCPNTTINLITWTSVSGLTYDIYWSTTQANATMTAGTKIASPTSPYSHTGLTAGTKYYYIIVATDSQGQKTASAQLSATPGVPAAPSCTAAGDGASSVKVTSASTNATSINLYYRTSAGVTTVNGTAVTGYTSATAVSGLSAGTKYYFVCTAVGAGGESTASAEANAYAGATSAPTFTVTSSSGQNIITITAPTTGTATSYKIYWDNNPIATTAAQTSNVISTTTSPYTHSGLTDGMVYRYAVSAVNANGESATATLQSVLMAKPQAPTGVAVDALSATTAAVSWATLTTGGPGSAGVTYNVYYSTTPGVVPGATGVTKLTGKTSSNSASIGATFTTATAYYFVVTANNAFGESSASIEAGVKVAANATNAPTRVRAGATANANTGALTTGGITLSWTAPTTAPSYYNVYYGTSATMTTTNGGSTKITAAAPGAATTFAITGLTSGVGYYFIVTAVTSAGVETASQTLYAVVP